MNRLALNLARRPFVNNMPPLVLLLLLGGGGIAFSTVNVSRFVASRSQIAALASRRTELEQRRRANEVEERDLARDFAVARSEVAASRGELANMIIQERVFSWTRLLNQLEEVVPIGIRVTSLRPRHEDGLRIRLDGVAKDESSFWDLQERLLADPAFGSVFPDVVQPLNTRAGLSGERVISLEFEYFPGAVEPDSDTGPERAGVESALASPATPTATGGAAADGAAADAPPPGDSEAAAAPGGGGLQVPVAAPPLTEAQRKIKRPRVGLERSSPFPAASPEVPVPDITIGRPAQLQGGEVRLPSTLENGTLIGEDGKEIPIEDVIIEGGIRPLEPGEENPPAPVPPPKAKNKRGKNKTGGKAP